MKFLILLFIVTTYGLTATMAAEPVPSRYVAPFPTSHSKKGLQVENVDDALRLGVKHAAINVDLCQLVYVSSNSSEEHGQPHWMSGGQRFNFNRDYLHELDHKIKKLSDQGIVVYLILLTYANADEQVSKLMLHPRYDPAAPNRLGMFNATTAEGRTWLTAVMEFLAERWSRPDEKFGRVSGYIVGNEVNSHWWWSNMGRASLEDVVDAYHAAVRLIHDAVRRQSSWARVYISLDHFWTMRNPPAEELQAVGGKAFLDEFARRAREEGDFDWHVAYHPYPEDLFNPRFWNDATALPEENTPRITFKNLDVLTRYLKRDELLYDGVPRRAILSEQGFHTPDGPDGELIQAAAYCAAYKQVERTESIDAFILHRHVDHPHEGGLRLGLRRLTPGNGEPHGKKLIYECFRAADTPEWEEAFRFALSIVGKKIWENEGVER